MIYMIHFCLSGRKTKKCNPSSREEIYCKLSSLSKSGNRKFPFPASGGIEFSPFHQGREKYKKDP